MTDNATYEAYYAELNQIVIEFEEGRISIEEFNRMKKNIDQWLADEMSEEVSK